MTRAIPAPLLAHLAGTEAHTVECLMLLAADGTRIGFTTSDVAQDADLGLGLEAYSHGMTLSELVLAAGVDASHVEVQGPIGPVLTRAALLGGRWDNAEAWLFRLSPDVAGAIAPLLYGRTREVRPEGNRFVLEVRGEADRLNQTIGRVITPVCDADFGDARCGMAVETVAATVAAVTDAMRFTVAFPGTFADDYFNLGTVAFTGGALAGTAPVEIFDWSAAGAVELFVPLAEAPATGDALELRRGCSKLRKAADPAIPTCMGYDNILNFRGFPEVPGSDQVLKVQVPGNAGA